MERYLLIDSSYFNFYRFYATMSWYQRCPERMKIGESMAPIDNEIFMKVYKKMWFETINKLIKKFKVDKSNVFFLRDGSQIWRYKFYKDYKSNRQLAEPNDLKAPGPVFKWTNENCLTDYKVIRDDEAEADDLAYILVNYLKGITNDSCDITIITGDKDFVQLLSFGVKIYQLKGLKEIVSNNPKRDLMIKIISGDSSDNIPPAFKGCGKKTAEKIADNPELLNEFIRKKGNEQYELNKLLIDFDNIPNEIIERVSKYLDVCLNI